MIEIICTYGQLLKVFSRSSTEIGHHTLGWSNDGHASLFNGSHWKYMASCGNGVAQCNLHPADDRPQRISHSTRSFVTSAAFLCGICQCSSLVATTRAQATVTKLAKHANAEWGPNVGSFHPHLTARRASRTLHALSFLSRPDPPNNCNFLL